MAEVVNKKHSLKVNAIFNAIYQVLILIVPLITTPYIARVLGASANGDYAYYYSIVSYFTLVAAFGFSDFGTKAIAEKRYNPEERSKCFYSISIAKAILGSLCLVAYIILCFTAFGGTKEGLYVSLIMSIWILATVTDPTFYFQGEERFVSVCLRNLFIKIVTTVLIFVLVKEPSDLIWYTLILAVGQFGANFIMLPSLLKKGELIKAKIKFVDIKEALKNAFPYFAPSLAVTLFGFLNQTLLGMLCSDSLQGGYYSQVMRIVQLLAMIAGSLSVVFLSRISYLYSIGDVEQIKITVQKAFKAFWLVVVPLIFGICAVNSVLLPAFLGDGYEPCIMLMYIMAPVIMFSPLNGMYGSVYFRPANKIWTQTIIIFIAAILNIILSVILIPTYGALGATIARLVAEFIQLPLLIICSYKAISLKTAFGSIVKPLISGSIMFVVVYLENIYLGSLINNSIAHLAVMIVSGIVVYGMFELILKDDIPYNIVKNVVHKIFKIK